LTGPAHSADEPSRRPPHAARPIIAIAALLLFALFAALGTWQVQRLRWKLALIERVEQRVSAPATATPGPERWSQVNAADDEYRHVQVTGHWLDEAETTVQASTTLGAGFWVLTPLRQADGSVVLINRGFVPPERRDPAAHSAGGATPATITGLLRITEPGGGFLRSNDPGANRWYSRDVQAITTARGLPKAAPYFIDADAGPRTDTAPVGGLTVISFHNNHLVYAMTWYTLALMTAWAAWRVMREDRSER
jgi:surfeit locus 1 family protein